MVAELLAKAAAEEAKIQGSQQRLEKPRVERSDKEEKQEVTVIQEHLAEVKRSG